MKKPKSTDYPTSTTGGRRIELRRISYNARLSEETSAYKAEVWLDGKLLCEVGNDGHGGPDHYYALGEHTQEDVRALDRWIKATYPKQPSSIEGLEDFEATLESVCGDLLMQHVAAKEMNRLISRTLVVFEPDQKSILTVPGKHPAGPERERLLAQVQAKHPRAIALEALPRDEALRLFRDHT